MKRSLIVALIALALLTGCDHAASPTAGSPGPTYTNRDFHFSIAYDPTQFKAAPRPMPAGRQFNLRLVLNKAQAGAGYRTDEVFVSTAYSDASMVDDLLAQWGKSDHPSWDAWIQGNAPGSAGWTWHWANLGGARGLRLEHTGTLRRSVCYLLFHGSQGYAVWFYVDPAQSKSVEPLLNKVVQSFQVTG